MDKESLGFCIDFLVKWGEICGYRLATPDADGKEADNDNDNDDAESKQNSKQKQKRKQKSAAAMASGTPDTFVIQPSWLTVVMRQVFHPNSPQPLLDTSTEALDVLWGPLNKDAALQPKVARKNYEKLIALLKRLSLAVDVVNDTDKLKDKGKEEEDEEERKGGGALLVPFLLKQTEADDATLDRFDDVQSVSCGDRCYSLYLQPAAHVGSSSRRSKRARGGADGLSLPPTFFPKVVAALYGGLVPSARSHGVWRTGLSVVAASGAALMVELPVKDARINVEVAGPKEEDTQALLTTAVRIIRRVVMGATELSNLKWAEELPCPSKQCLQAYSQDEEPGKLQAARLIKAFCSSDAPETAEAKCPNCFTAVRVCDLLTVDVFHFHKVNKDKLLKLLICAVQGMAHRTAALVAAAAAGGGGGGDSAAEAQLAQLKQELQELKAYMAQLIKINSGYDA